MHASSKQPTDESSNAIAKTRVSRVKLSPLIYVSPTQRAERTLLIPRNLISRRGMD
jgi:hypothetical protein